MAQECQRLIMCIAILLSEEAGMCLAPDMVAEAVRDEPRDSWETRMQGELSWQLESIPRLQPSDLSNPEVYHRRLETYIMNLK